MLYISKFLGSIERICKEICTFAKTTPMFAWYIVKKYELIYNFIDNPTFTQYESLLQTFVYKSPVLPMESIKGNYRH